MLFFFLIGVNRPFFKAQKVVNPTFTFEEPPPFSGRLSQHCYFHCSTAHQLHQPSVCHPVYGRPQQPQLSSQHRWKEGASLPGRRGHEWPAGIELGTDWTLPTLPRPAQPSAELTRSLILCLYQLKKKRKKKRKKQEHCIKCIKWRTTFLSDCSIIFCSLTEKKNPLVMKRNHFIDIYSVLLLISLTSSSPSQLPPPLSCI